MSVKAKELLELWHAIGNKKEREFYTKHPDFEFAEEDFMATIKKICDCKIEQHETDKKVKNKLIK